jgi:cyclopropane-fatty-acyl-phospholipid synthase
MRGWHALRRNTRDGSRRNIAAHYDLGNDFFRLFLSEDLMYSSALSAGDDDTLEAASTRKLDRICRKLRLASRTTTWSRSAPAGAASRCTRHDTRGCRVTTTTISREQHALASQRVADAGLQDRVTVLLSDYRDLQGQYDKLVSIEMIEAIGAQYLDTYFASSGAC